MSDPPPTLLQQLLDEACQVEHYLLNTCLFAASSLKSFPAEFATLPDGRENRCRAVRFERSRAWKRAILGVAHQEMVHLHYIQCLQFQQTHPHGDGYVEHPLQRSLVEDTVVLRLRFRYHQQHRRRRRDLRLRRNRDRGHDGMGDPVLPALIDQHLPPCSDHRNPERPC